LRLARSAYEDLIAYLLKNGPQTARAKELGPKIGKTQAFVVIAFFWGTKKQIIKLQQVDMLFYKRVP
jgi:hypothetical protein